MESGTLMTAAGLAVDAPTLTEALRRTASHHPDVIAVRTPDDSVSLTWSELLERVDAVAGGLAKLGVGAGDTVAIMLVNRPEFHIVDLAAVTIGATPFSIYTTYPAAEIEYLIKDSKAKLAIAEQAFLPVMLEARENLPGLEHVIVVDGEATEETLALADVEGSNPDFDAAEAASSVAPDDVLTLIYTSGTTAIPRASSSPTTTSCSRPGPPPRSSSSSPGAAWPRGCPRRTSPSATRITTCRSSSPGP